MKMMRSKKELSIGHRSIYISMEGWKTLVINVAWVNENLTAKVENMKRFAK